jgi:hypothetical protein
VRRCLAGVFSIPNEVEPWVGGAVVGADYRLRAGDSLEFLVRRGLKSLGDLLTPEQLIQRWQIDNDKYLQLLDAGLPTVRFKGGSVRHPEVAVDEWLRRRYASGPDLASTPTAIEAHPDQRVYTVKEAATVYFQGRVSQRELYNLFDQGEILGFRVGKQKILIYKSSLDAYRLAHENKKPPIPEPEPEAPIPAPLPQPNKRRQITNDLPPIRLKKLPSP